MSIFLRLQRTHGPEFPVDALPPWLGQFVVGVANSLQVPQCMPAAFALGVLSMAAAGKGCIRLHADWREPFNLFIGLVAPSGSRKSAVARAFLEPVERYERALVVNERPAVVARRVERSRLQKQLQKAQEADDWGRAQELEAALEVAPLLPVPRLFADDVTAQKLVGMLAEHKRMAILSAEPSIFPTMLGRWASGKGDSEIDVFLKGHSGDSIRVDRVTRPSEVLDAPCLTMCLGLQPHALQAMSRPDFLSRGLTARFLWVLSPDQRGQSKLSASSPIDERCKTEFEAGLVEVLKLPLGTEIIELSVSACSEFEAFYDEIQTRLAPGGDLRDLSGWGEKLCGHVGRIAALLHVAQQRAGDPVEASTMQQAVRVGKWAIEHAKVAFEVMGSVPQVRAARAILEVIRAQHRACVTEREIHQQLRGRKEFKSKASLSAGFRLLVSEALLVPATESAVGRPSARFDVKPEVFDDEAEF